MKKITFLLLSFLVFGQFLFAAPPTAAQNKCMRVMSPEELSKEAELIIRIKVTKVERATYLGLYEQVATVKVTEVIDGDTTLKDKEIRIWAQSRIPCAADSYTLGDELLVFLVREVTFYHTLNYQYGQFHLQNEQVLGWRDKDKGEIAKNYPDVTSEIRTILVTHNANGAAMTPPASPKP